VKRGDGDIDLFVLRRERFRQRKKSQGDTHRTEKKGKSIRQGRVVSASWPSAPRGGRGMKTVR